MSTEKALTPSDTSKTSWKNRAAKNTRDAGTDSEKVLTGASDAVTAACAFGVMPQLVLHEGDPLWTEGYEHALQLKILFNVLRHLTQDLLHRGECLLVTPCGKVIPVPDHGSIRSKCEDPDCERCNSLIYGQSIVELVGTGKHLLPVNPETHAYPYRHWDR